MREALGQVALEIAESAILTWLEPKPRRSCYEDVLLRALEGIARAEDGRLTRFRNFVNRNDFLFACLDYTADRREEHLVVGYGFRHGSTTKVTGLHHVVGDLHAVQIPTDS
jgi:hypothetical protein